MKFELSRSQWEEVGRLTGWMKVMKQAYAFPSRDATFDFTMVTFSKNGDHIASRDTIGIDEEGMMYIVNLEYNISKSRGESFFLCMDRGEAIKVAIVDKNTNILTFALPQDAIQIPIYPLFDESENKPNPWTA